MADVDAITLSVAVEAVDALITTLAAELEANPDASDGGVLEMDLLRHTKAAHKLEIAYREATKNASNMPPYERLVRN